jgi:hypothetical protein
VTLKTLNIVKCLQVTQSETEKKLENQLDIKMKQFQEQMKSGLYHPSFNIVDFTQKTDSKFLNGNEIQNSQQYKRKLSLK